MNLWTLSIAYCNRDKYFFTKPIDEFNAVYPAIYLKIIYIVSKNKKRERCRKKTTQVCWGTSGIPESANILPISALC
jgi:hypothetical protein